MYQLDQGTATTSNVVGVTTVAIGGRIFVLDFVRAAPEPILPPLNPKGLLGGDLLTWLFWTAWQFGKRAVDWRRRNVRECTFRYLSPRRPRGRARRHAPNHSPRRFCYAA